MKKRVSIVYLLLLKVLACYAAAAAVGVLVYWLCAHFFHTDAKSTMEHLSLIGVAVASQFIVFALLLKRLLHQELSRVLRGVHRELRFLDLKRPEPIYPNKKWLHFLEYESLLAAINRIIASLAESRRELQINNEALEQRVADKTAELREQNLELIKLNQKLSRLANTDALTQVYNRTRFDQLFQEHVEVSRRRGTALGFLLIDLDDFKKVNDRYGHQTGDKVLKHAAACITKVIGENGMVARWGGEEFAVLLPYFELDKAMEIAEHLRQTLANTPFDIQHIHITTSIGVAQLRDDETGDELLSRADEALYSAKGKGRNQVIMAATD
ncbi:diguanylate cyclase [Maribrevibacterium harenarium]|uniref:diguanylate cyclase n=1 Tax=Maribrevibacterium harenarium TaxID=2589817 RepID=A0A501X0X3_9GAMM|nr:GGDEF domain-containing protein [Maribrevibacterium harenarium]TPE52786.1 diguanylate cyclase [Maribrevibacterium harenarium]